jgi:uncharacterized repeat protein (TIGR01451 family)
MEYLPGPNLRQLLDELIRQREWVSLNDAVRLVEQLCEAIEYAHLNDSLHWDINPANLMIKPEPAAGLPFRVVLIDLQLARLLEVLENDEDRPLPGTPAYMSPEQLLGSARDIRSNIYSLGVLLYELVVGIPPFPIKSAAEARLYYARGEVTPAPRSVRPDLPEGLERVMMKALEKDPAERFASAAELGAALAAAMGDLTEISEQESAPDGNLFQKYQESLAAPPRPEPASLLSEPEVGKTQMQSVYATERMDLPPAGQATIQVQMEGRPPQIFTPEKDTVVIGRDRDNDLILDDPRISRRHAQLTREGLTFYVMDLNSANGTYLDNARIPSGAPTVWRPQQELKMGGASLRLMVMGAAPTGTILESYGAGSHTMLGAFEAEPVVITVTPQQLTVEAGDSVTATLSLLNQGFEPDYFSLSMTGIPNDWVSSLPSHIELMPGEQKVIAFTLDIPRSHQSRAGRHAITLTATSQRDPRQAAELKMNLTISPFSEFRAELQPRLQAGQVGRITISNLGNLQETFTVRLADIAGELAFEPVQAQIRIPEGQTGIVEFRAAESQLRLLGGQKTHTVSAVVSTPTAEPQALHGELISLAFLPAWVLPATLLLCMFTAGAAALLFLLINRSATLTVTKNGEGTVTSSPVGIDCGSICEYNFDRNDTVTLSAEPASTYTFGGWSGGGCSGTGPCTISMRSDQTVTAIFSPPGTKTLVVFIAGTGTGTVTSTPPGINTCLGTGTSTTNCSYAFADNTIVTLNAVPGGTSTFGGWSGACAGAGTSLTCTVTMNDIQNVIATFNLPGKKTLTVIKSGNGTVTSSPAGINCGTICTFDYPDNTQVTLTASATSPSTFGSWSGACSGSSTTCTVSMTAAQTVTATFNSPASQTLAVTKSGTGNGTVTSSPGGINCGTTCTVAFAFDTVVRLTAAATSPSSFGGWGGACAGFGTSPTCDVRMNAAQNVTVTFSAGNPDLRVEMIRSGNFTPGQTGQYTITVSNLGAGPTNGDVNVVTILPPGLAPTTITGTGWSCPSGTLSCSRSDPLAAGSSYPGITVTVSVAANASGSVTSSVTVSGGGDQNQSNNGDQDTTIINPQAVPDLTITMNQPGTVRQGAQNLQYTILISNDGAGPTNGTLRVVVEPLPLGQAFKEIKGQEGGGWECIPNALICTRSSPLQPGGVTFITLTVDIRTDAPSPLINKVSISGGGDQNATNNNAEVSTTVEQIPPTEPSTEEPTEAPVTSLTQIPAVQVRRTKSYFIMQSYQQPSNEVSL